MTGLSTGWSVGFDLETSCASPNAARIVTATLVQVADATAEVGKTTEWLVNPGIDIPAGATAIHGITTERAREDGQDPEGAIFDLVGKLARTLGAGHPVYGHNLAYDLTVLDRECRRHGIDPLSERLDFVGPFVDSMVIDKAVDPFRRGKRTLTVTAEHYGVVLDDAHNSTADALASVRISHQIFTRYAHARVLDAVEVPYRDRDNDDAYRIDFPRDLTALHVQQVAWRDHQQTGLANYFRKQNNHEAAASVSVEWPIQLVSEDWDPLFHPTEQEAA